MIILSTMRPNKLILGSEIEQVGCFEIDDIDEQWLLCNDDKDAL